MKNILISLAFIICSFPMMGQQEIILTKYTYNSLFFNPSYAGSHGENEGTALLHYRNQWLGLDGAPTTLMFGAESSLFENRVGLGLTMAKESIGIESRIDVNTNYAYRIQLGPGQLAGGLRVGWSNYRSDFKKLVNIDVSDPNYSRPDINYNLLSIGAGTYYNTQNFYAGLSVPAIAVIGDKPGASYRVRHFYLHSGLMIGDEYSTVKFEPSILLKLEKAAPIQFTLGMNVWISDGIAIGGHYRSNDAFALSTELRYKKKYQIALAYDFTLSDIRKYSDGTLEFLVGYQFNTDPSQQKIRNIRHGGRF